MKLTYLKYRKFKNFFFHLTLVSSGVLVIFPLLMIVKFIIALGLESLSWDFFIQLPRPVGETGGGMFHAIFGTFYLVGIGALIAVPLGILAGVFISEYKAGKVTSALKFSIDLLTGVPSIVVGIFAYLLIVAPFKGFSALAGGIALSIIILPTVARSTEEILKLVPIHIREAGLALGLPRWKVIYFIIVRGSKQSLLTGIMLAISRASGETAPLLFTAFGNRHFSADLAAPMASLPVQIYNYAISPFAQWQKQAWAGALVLIIIVFGMNLLIRALVNKNSIVKMIKKIPLNLGRK